MSDWIIRLIEQSGYLGIGFLMFLETVFPPIPSEVDHYTWWQRRRITIKPGLTCIWQVYGRNRVSFKRWVEMDLYYIDNWSLWMDIKLLLHTFRAVLRGTGM